jgi:hypothetical protein
MNVFKYLYKKNMIIVKYIIYIYEVFIYTGK